MRFLGNPRTGKTVKPYSCGMTVYYMNYMFYTLWDELDSAGLTAYLDQNDRSAFNSTEFNSPEVKRVFEILFDLIGATSETESNMCAAAEDHLASQTNFVNGNCVFTFSGVWFETEMKKILDSVGMTDYHYGSYPVVNAESKNRLYMNMPGEFFFIPSDAENVWGAKDFLAFCMSEKGVAAAEKVLNMPLAFSTDEKIAFSSFGEEIRDVVEKSKKLYIYSTNDVYRTGALSLFKQDTNPLLQMSKYTVKSKNEIQSKCIDPEVSKHAIVIRINSRISGKRLTLPLFHDFFYGDAIIGSDCPVVQLALFLQFRMCLTEAHITVADYRPEQAPKQAFI